ncbi:MAG: nucleotide exchange factor GrpE [Clostridiales bacterium]|nr:nucleotide exchange factor GrpE [Clostridiales bacterium]
MSGKNSEVAKNHFKINDEYKSLTNFVGSFISKANTKTFNSINLFVNNKLLELKDNNLLKNKDEDIYLYCNYLNESFKKFINLYNKNKRFITSYRKIEILDGLKLILSNQISQYFEIYNEKEINPILEEKLKIIRGSMGSFERRQLKSLDNNTIVLGKDITSDVIFNISKQPNQDELFVSAIVDNFAGFIESNVYSNYLLVKAECLGNINGLERRKVTTKYLELMKQEYEILSSIIKVQVAPLERIVSQTSEEKVAIDKMLSIIRESYQFISRKFDELSVFLLEAEKLSRLNPDEDKGNFDKECTKFIYDSMNNLEMKFFFNIVKEKYNSIIKKVEANIVNKVDAELTAYALEIYKTAKENFKSYTLLTKEFLSAVNIFINFDKAYAEKAIDVPAEDILAGVSETIKIKRDSISEGDGEFKQRCIPAIGGVLQNNFEFNQKESTHLSQLLEGITSLPDLEADGKDISNRFYLATMGDPEFESFLDKRIKALEAKKDKINKVFFNYLKENILSEIMSFEEIEHYSISKLKGPGHDILNKYSLIFEKVMFSIDRILEKNNIERISPSVHDLFNPKEHEILVAEKKDGFNKGEIIKPLNNGFKKDGAVIIRANIVAAK